MLKPLEQFICDKCKGVIEDPKLGYVEYLGELSEPIGKMIQIRSGFKIVHNSQEKSCYFYKRSVEQKTLPLSDFLNENKFSMIYSYLDEGAILSPERVSVQIKNIREFTDFARRLCIPYYEEARCYFDQAIADEFFDGANEFHVYSVQKMQQIVEEYSDK
jgi:hypothetical protein